jgi:FkbM family methyltransferase
MIRQLARKVLSLPPISHLPVRVQRGLAAGASWSLFPWTSYWRGLHEPQIQARLIDLMDWRGKSVWDLGSHFGLFAVGLGRRVGPSGAVAAFEPHPRNFSRLQLHLRRNRLSWAQAFPCAVSDQPGHQQLLLEADVAAASTVGHLLYEGETWRPDIPQIKVETCALDAWVESGKIRAPDFIKVDVEGHGHKALAGARRTITAKRPILLMGFHSSVEVQGTEELLKPLGYRFEAIPPDAPADRVGADYLLFPERI